MSHHYFHLDPQYPFETRLFQTISYETTFRHRTYKRQSSLEHSQAVVRHPELFQLFWMSCIMPGVAMALLTVHSYEIGIGQVCYRTCHSIFNLN